MTGMPPREGPRTDPPRRAPQAWEDALAAAALLALDPVGLQGAAVRAGPGPARDRWLEELRRLLPGWRWIRLPPQSDPERLTGGLDLAESLRAGAPRRRRGLLEDADGIILVLPMAERLGPSLAGPLALAEGRRVLTVALDEGREPEEAPPPQLMDRLAFRLSLDGLSMGDATPSGRDAAGIARARSRLGAAREDPTLAEAFVSAAALVGEPSLRAPLFALRAARGAAALTAAAEVEAEAAALAARLAIAPRARSFPEPEAPGDQAEEEGSPPPETNERASSKDRMEDVVLAAVRTAVPDALLGASGPRTPGGEGAGGERSGSARGRRIAARPCGARKGVRLDLPATLLAAAPWQGLRRREAPGAGAAILVRPDDLREAVRVAPAERLVVFVVDASGSAAMTRLAEAKGAVEHLLSRAYAARDSVALVAFRGRDAQVLLPPTRALARVRRSLAALPGGGGTPLAAGLMAGRALANEARRRGVSACMAVLTDGRANVALDGSSGRAGAAEDARRSARLIRAEGIGALVIDSSPRPAREPVELASWLGGTCLPLPRARGAAFAASVAAHLGG